MSVTEVSAATDLRRFTRVAFVTLVAVTALVVAVGLVVNEGHFVYVFDDTAIHMSMAQQLTHHLTWGVTAHHYASASSSPGWTLLLSAFTFVLPFARDYLPLLLNLAAAAWVLTLIGKNQDFLRIRVTERLSAIVTVLAVSVLWFLPGLMLAGMEHVLHAALFLWILLLIDRAVRTPLTRRTSAQLLVTIAIATTIRFETAFIAVGCAVAVILATQRTFGRDTQTTRTPRNAVRLGAAMIAASAFPLAVYGVINKAFGEGYLPNSILAKTGQGRILGLFRAPQGALGVLVADPSLFALFLISAVYLIWVATDGPQRNTAIAIVFTVTTVLHAFLADVGWFERYQAYLIIGGSFVALRIAAEVCSPERRRRALVVALVVVSALAFGKAVLLAEAPIALSNTYRQRYQLGRFLKQYYNGHAILTGELGYTTLLHQGAVVDILGLGTYPVAVERHRGVEQLDARFVERLAHEAHVKVMAFYAFNPGMRIPKAWTLIAQWHLDEPKISIPDRDIAFYAPTHRDAKALERHLRQFEPQLPSRVTAVYRAELIRNFLENS